MRNNLINTGVVFVVILLVGFFKVPYEVKVEKELREDEILPPKISIEDRNNIGQAGYAAALGGMKDIISSLSFLEAFNSLADLDWFETDRLFNKVVTLQPRSEHYWHAAGYHLAYTAQMSISSDPNLEPSERLKNTKDIIRKGDDYLKRGLQALPGNQKLSSTRIMLLRDHFRYPDAEKAYKIASEQLRNSVSEPNEKLLEKSSYLFTLGELGEREAFCYSELKKHFESLDIARKVPTQRVLFYVLQNQTLVKAADRVGEEILLFYPEYFYDLVSVYSYPQKIASSVKTELMYEYSAQKEALRKTIPGAPVEATLAKILLLETVLGVNESNSFLGQYPWLNKKQKEYVYSLLSYKLKVDELGVNLPHSIEVLKKKCDSGKASRFEKEILGIAQLLFRKQLGDYKPIPVELLCYTPRMKYHHLKNFWNTTNDKIQNVIKKQHDKMGILPTGRIVSEIQLLEEEFNIPEQLRIKSQDIYTPFPN